MIPIHDYLKLDQQLCFALYTAHRSMLKRYTPLLEPFKLTYAQYLVLLALYEKDDVPIKDLCQRLSLDTGTLTPLLKRMAATGWINRQRDSADERVVFIKLAIKARENYHLIAQIPIALAAQYTCGTETLSDLVELRTKLQHLNKLLLTSE